MQKLFIACVGTGAGCQSQAGFLNLKSEVRNPNPETRNFGAIALRHFPVLDAKTDFNLRGSGFFRISGVRISDFGLNHAERNT